MKNMEIITETSKRIDGILADRDKELISLADQISAEAEAVAAANNQMEAATAAGDLEAYRRAKNARAEALDAQEMHQARKEALKNKPLISRQEYDKTVSAIVSAVAGVESDCKKELCALSDQMAAVAADLEAVASAANEVLRRLQHDVYLDADRTRNPKTGEVIPMLQGEKKVSPYSTIEWGRKGINCGQYKAFTMPGG